MGGDNTCKMCADDCKATCLGCWSDLDTGGNYQKRLFSDCCADPGLFVYSCCCPCLLTGQISQEMGRNCCAAPRGRHICGRRLDRGGDAGLPPIDVRAQARPASATSGTC